jgi:hypothetical protein
MEFIFCNLPTELINKILLYDQHFIMRKGDIVSIIPKTDYRYNLVKYVIPSLRSVDTTSNNTIRYNYYFPNLYNYDGRSIYNPDMIQVNMNEYDDFIKYSFWIGRQYPKTVICDKKQNYYIENKLDYQWIYTEFEYIRE